MKVMHVHAKSDVDVSLSEEALKQLPKTKWGVVTTVQHMHKIQAVIDQLEHAQIAGQVLGCNASEAESIDKDVESWLFVGSGIFHPVQVALRTKKPVWLWSPIEKELRELDPTVIKKFEQEKRAQLAKFLHAKTVGVIVTTKIGQKNLMRAKEFAKQTDKECYLFACDELDMRQFENFNFIEFWVNTACPRIADERKNMVNIDDLIDAGYVKLDKDASAYEVPIWKSSMGLGK